MYQTSYNPGAFSKRQKTRLIYFLKKLVKSLAKGNVTEAVNYLVSESINIWNDQFSELKIGKECLCNICGYKGRFVHKSNRLGIAWNSICPNCDSRSRHRGLYILYQNLVVGRDSILHFAPEPILAQLFKGSPLYKSADLFLNDVDFKGEDIQELTFRAGSFDWVLCNHVIEHVPNDASAFSEVNRILKPGGHAIITVPGNFSRRKTILFDDLSLNGHYRDYGADLIDKLKEFFDVVEPVDLSALATAENLAIKRGEYAFVCKRRESQ